jgi:hypothetical protein
VRSSPRHGSLASCIESFVAHHRAKRRRFRHSNNVFLGDLGDQGLDRGLWNVNDELARVMIRCGGRQRGRAYLFLVLSREHLHDERWEDSRIRKREGGCERRARTVNLLRKGIVKVEREKATHKIPWLEACTELPSSGLDLFPL